MSVRFTIHTLNQGPRIASVKPALRTQVQKQPACAANTVAQVVHTKIVSATAQHSERRARASPLQKGAACPFARACTCVVARPV